MKNIIVLATFVAGFIVAGCGPGTVESEPEKTIEQQKQERGGGQKRGGPMETTLGDNE